MTCAVASMTLPSESSGPEGWGGFDADYLQSRSSAFAGASIGAKVYLQRVLQSWGEQPASRHLDRSPSTSRYQPARGHSALIAQHFLLSTVRLSGLFRWKATEGLMGGDTNECPIH
ncbi:hypothetical protein R1flu_027450 [Riccia fluitans]|uniref:Uncharacterized protein n=1 Tax=Riccia fluitans TaxID=41844 RepID=A0ABD1XIV3_9MARC